MSLDMSIITQRAEMLDRNVKDVIMLVVVTALGGLLLYQHYRLQKAVELINMLASQVPGAN
jgi:hypothetical protein